MEIVQERLEREYNVDLITTAPTVIYEVITQTDQILMVDRIRPKLPEGGTVKEIREPIIRANILVSRNLSGRRNYALYRKARRTERYAVCWQTGVSAL